jgi:hypothetical protein
MRLIKLLKESCNDVDQYFRRDSTVLKVRGLPSVSSDWRDNTNDVVLKVAKKIAWSIDLAPSNISVSHPLPNRAVLAEQGGNTCRLNAEKPITACY